MNSVMSRYIHDPKNNKCKIPVFSVLTTRGTGQGRIHFSFIWNGAGQDSVPPRFRETFTFRVHRGGPFRHASATLPPTLKIRSVPCPPRWAVPPRFRYASAIFEISFRSVSTEGYCSANLNFCFRHASAELQILFRSVSTEEGRSTTLPLRFCPI